MKKFSLFILLMLATIGSEAAVQFSFKVSRLGSIFQMLNNLADHNRYQPYFLIADTSQLYTPEIRKQVEATATQIHWESIDYQSYPSSRKYGRGTKELFIMAAYKSQTFEELRSRTVGYLTLKEQDQVIKAMNAIAPVFDGLVWKKYGARADSQAKVLAEYTLAHNIDDYFAKAIQFYGAAIPDSMTFDVFINPLPPGLPFFTASPHQSILITDIPYKAKRWENIISVIFHETCHVLYGEQTTDKQKDLENAFLGDTKKRFSNGLPYSWLDEALATTLGNGACFKLLSGKLDTADWYNDATISGFAKGMYPTVQHLIEQNKSVFDPTFKDSAIAIFYHTFLDKKIEPVRVFPYYSLLTDSVDLNNWQNLYGHHFRTRSSSAFSQIDEQALNGLDDRPDLGIVLIKRNQAVTWAKLAKRQKDLSALIVPANRKSVGKNGTWYVLKRGASGRAWLLVNVNQESDLELVLNDIDQPKS